MDQHVTFLDPVKIWGGENLELSLRIWTCGGEMEIVPCSRVGHIYKIRQVYSYPGAKSSDQVISCNSRRVAEVWLDEYKYLYDSTRNVEQKSAGEFIKISSFPYNATTDY